MALDVEAARDRRDQVELRISVSDTGIGFDEEVRARLFDRFEQADGSITRRYRRHRPWSVHFTLVGRGHGRGAGCQFHPGEGSTFSLSLSLPLAAEDTLAAEPALASQPAPDGCRPQRPARRGSSDQPRVVQLILEGLDVDLTCVEDGAQAVEAAAAATST